MGNAADDLLNARSSPQAEERVVFPRFLIEIGFKWSPQTFKRSFMTRESAIAILGSSEGPVCLGDDVLLADYTVRPITRAECDEINRAGIDRCAARGDGA